MKIIGVLISPSFKRAQKPHLVSCLMSHEPSLPSLANEREHVAVLENRLHKVSAFCPDFTFSASLSGHLSDGLPPLSGAPYIFSSIISRSIPFSSSSCLWPPTMRSESPGTGTGFFFLRLSTVCRERKRSVRRPGLTVEPVYSFDSNRTQLFPNNIKRRHDTSKILPGKGSHMHCKVESVAASSHSLFHSQSAPSYESRHIGFAYTRVLSIRMQFNHGEPDKKVLLQETLPMTCYHELFPRIIAEIGQSHVLPRSNWSL
jgi:hypothetical protein